jgi:RNA-directed DNA polymerase
MRKKFADYFSKQKIVLNFNERVSQTKARGTDGTHANTFGENLNNNAELIRRKVLRQSYKFSRYKEKLILKGSESLPREVCIPTVRDRCALRCLLNYIDEVFPEGRAKRPHAYIKSITERLMTATTDECFVRLDIKNFYPSIEHRKLIATLRKRMRNRAAVSLIESAITTSCKKGAKRTKGVPQGLSISNHLSNIFLLGIDEHFAALFGPNNYYRYVDDLLVLAPSANARERFSLLEEALKSRKLQVHPLDAKKGKSLICPVVDGVDYLGFRISPARVSVRESSIRKMYETLSSVITSAKYTKNIGRMCFKLDTKISGCIFEEERFGWLHFFQQMNDLPQLARLDAFVGKMLGRVSNLPQEYRPKRFLKAYHEIRFNSQQSDYIPNFDTKNKEEQVRILTQIAPGRYRNIELRGEDEIKSAFFMEMKRIASELERDLQEPSS